MGFDANDPARLADFWAHVLGARGASTRGAPARPIVGSELHRTRYVSPGEVVSHAETKRTESASMASVKVRRCGSAREWRRSPRCREPSAGESGLVVAEDLFLRPLVEHGQGRTAQCDLIEFVGHARPVRVPMILVRRSGTAMPTAVVIVSPVASASWRASRSVSGSLMLSR